MVRIICPYFLRELAEHHFIEPGDEVFISPASYGHGWLEIWKEGKLFISTLETGLYRRLLEHILKCPGFYFSLTPPKGSPHGPLDDLHIADIKGKLEKIDEELSA